MFFDLLHFGSGLQAFHYIIFCFAAILGAIQISALYYYRRDLLWIEGLPGYILAIVIVVSGFIWFFLADEEIFIPGLAGAELFTLFTIAFVIAVPFTRMVAYIRANASSLVTERIKARHKKESIL